MRFEDLLGIVGSEPVFETGLLLAGDVDPVDVRRQLSRWTRAGRLYQLRRGLYALAPPFQKVQPHPFLVANRLVPGSYVSLQSVLAEHSLIPEYVPVTTSVTTSRPGRWDTPLGSYLFRHLQPDLITGFRRTRSPETRKPSSPLQRKPPWTSSTWSRTPTPPPTSPSSAFRTWKPSTWSSSGGSPRPQESRSSFVR